MYLLCMYVSAVYVCICCVCHAVVLLYVSDETTSWVEVFLEGKKRFVCLHLPSCSVDQPRMCEKRCPHKMSYIIAIESG